MKKTTIALGVVTIFATGILLYSCKKSQLEPTVQPTQNHYPVELRNNLLGFNTINDYATMADNQAKEKFIAYVNSMDNFTLESKTNAARANGEENDYADIENDFLKSILNKDAAVQIGDYILKIAKKKEKVFVLPKSKLNEANYKDLIKGNIKNANIREFSTGDDVLGLVNQKSNRNPVGVEDGGGGGGGGGGGSTGSGLFCGESGISNERESGINYFFRNIPLSTPIDVEIAAKIKYERYGIYFTLYSKMDGSTRISQITYLIDWQIYYHVRCGTTVGNPFPSYYGQTTQNALQDDRCRHPSYQGSKSLNEVRMQCRWGIKVTAPNGALEYFTVWHEIRENC